MAQLHHVHQGSLYPLAVEAWATVADLAAEAVTVDDVHAAVRPLARQIGGGLASVMFLGCERAWERATPNQRLLWLQEWVEAEVL